MFVLSDKKHYIKAFKFATVLLKVILKENLISIGHGMIMIYYKIFAKRDDFISVHTSIFT